MQYGYVTRVRYEGVNTNIKHASIYNNNIIIIYDTSDHSLRLQTNSQTSSQFDFL